MSLTCQVTLTKSDGSCSLTYTYLSDGTKVRARIDREFGIDLAKIDFGARFYDPYTARWTTPDPLATKYPDVSPYTYCAKDPVNKFDPDGKTDFFNNDGQLLFRDAYDNGMICITTTEQIDKLREFLKNEISIEKRDELVQGVINEGQTFTAALRNGVFNENPNAALKIMQHYCDMPFTLGSNHTIDTNGKEHNGPFMTFKGAITADLDIIKVQGTKVGSLSGIIYDAFYDNSYNIKSSVDVHEKYHVNDPLYDGLREKRAYLAEKNSPIFYKCSTRYRDNVNNILKNDEYK